MTGFFEPALSSAPRINGPADDTAAMVAACLRKVRRFIGVSPGERKSLQVHCNLTNPQCSPVNHRLLRGVRSVAVFFACYNYCRVHYGSVAKLLEVAGVRL